jgi:hypothetical protein
MQVYQCLSFAFIWQGGAAAPPKLLSTGATNAMAHDPIPTAANYFSLGRAAALPYQVNHPTSYGVSR